MGIGKVLYVSSDCSRIAELASIGLIELTERHSLKLIPANFGVCADVKAKAIADGTLGVVIEMRRGWPDRQQTRVAKRSLQSERRVWFYWPSEEAVECVDWGRLASFRRLRWFVKACVGLEESVAQLTGVKRRWLRGLKTSIARVVAKGKDILRPTYRLVKRIWTKANDLPLTKIPNPRAAESAFEVIEDAEAQVVSAVKTGVELVISKACPSHFRITMRDGMKKPLFRNGAYLRTDFWAKINSGGSYGHTCYVAKSLGGVTKNLVCFMANQYSLLDELGVEQVLLRTPGWDGNELNILRATDLYYRQLGETIRELQPEYIYERLCLGNFTGAKLSQEYKIPYIVEYNGSEISMNRSFGGSGYTFEKIFLKAEDAAFRQATLISVISEPVRDDLVHRGVDPRKILINPNGVDPVSYEPASTVEKRRLRKELGLNKADTVIGFTGTFGGWHGVDVLAEIIPRVCSRNRQVQLLLIGDGNYKYLIDNAISVHGLERYVVSVGRVAQKEGARLLKACDIYISPHNSHMLDSKFFGSPTKIFEYMAMGGGIVASDLEQIGKVLKPCLRSEDLTRRKITVKDERSILCTPGSVEQFVEAILYLVDNPLICQALGNNARVAAIERYSWDNHVENLWRFLGGASQKQLTSELF